MLRVTLYPYTCDSRQMAEVCKTQLSTNDMLNLQMPFTPLNARLAKKSKKGAKSSRA